MIENVPVSNLEIRIAGFESIQQIVPQRGWSPRSPHVGLTHEPPKVSQNVFSVDIAPGHAGDRRMEQENGEHMESTRMITL